MKTSGKLAACFLLAIVPALFPRAVHAANMNIGGVVWFAWWDFSLKDSIRGNFMPHASLYNRYVMKPTFLYGPMISFDFAKYFAFSAMFMYTDTYRVYSKSVSILSPDEYQKDRYSISKYDLDTTFSYSPVRFFKIFTGFKFQGYDFTGTVHELDIDGTGFRKNWISGTDRSLGTGLGIGFTIPIVEGLYIQWNLSGLYLNMHLNYHTDFFKLETSPSILYIPGVMDMKFRYHSYGGNTNASLAYLISKISSTIILGFRYQIIYNTLYGLDLEEHILNIPFNSAQLAYIRDRYMQHKGNSKKYDHFYGLSFAFIYSFEIAREEKGEDD